MGRIDSTMAWLAHDICYVDITGLFRGLLFSDIIQTTQPLIRCVSVSAERFISFIDFFQQKKSSKVAVKSTWNLLLEGFWAHRLRVYEIWKFAKPFFSVVWHRKGSEFHFCGQSIWASIKSFSFFLEYSKLSWERWRLKKTRYSALKSFNKNLKNCKTKEKTTWLVKKNSNEPQYILIVIAEC